ncbi:hypothetical protein ERO13_A09G023500v2 [Gossypium hirsutum]|uniref:Uncharacterized protein n=1 Tax=Gossypium tomentosum TaxID=34277 RepID=A0A5D2NXN4_GOSTO|nr:hypothetical protein ERO13_A09G023500v2 [Gossypium hirsutum]TYI08837.1 hypothetical protein ES332_A09G029900v1 [Gossypium tomentosum]
MGISIYYKGFLVSIVLDFNFRLGFWLKLALSTCCKKCKKCPICHISIEERLPVYDVYSQLTCRKVGVILSFSNHYEFACDFR